MINNSGFRSQQMNFLELLKKTKVRLEHRNLHDERKLMRFIKEGGKIGKLKKKI